MDTRGALSRIDPAGLGIGVGAVLGLAYFLGQILYWTREFLSLSRSGSVFVEIIQDEEGVVLVAWLLECLALAVGGYFAATWCRGKELWTGTAVGAGLGALCLAVGIAVLFVSSRNGLILIVSAALTTPAAWAGARLGLWRQRKWKAECDALDPWKKRPTA